MNKEIKLVIFDLDGTLLSSNKTILESSKTIIKRLYENNIMVGICSGRIFQMLNAYVKMIDLKGYVLSTNSASIYSTITNEKIYSCPLTKDQAKKIVDYCLLNNFDCSLLTDSTCYFTRNSVRVERFIQYNEISKKENLKEIPISYMDVYPESVLNVEKVLIYSTDQEVCQKAFSFLDTVCGIYAIFSEPGLIDISSDKASKGIGVKKLASMLGLDKNNIMSFGDYDNDITMLNESKYSIAMGNSNDEVKAISSFVTKDNDSDGIYYAIKKIIFEE
jgi:Cof subfamily protein (haloacid dehalogenase superfamily)